MFSKKWKIYFQNKKWLQRLKPYFSFKFCLIYLLSISVGFYFWGPFQADQFMKRILPGLGKKQVDAVALQKMQKELSFLKKQLSYELKNKTKRPQNTFSVAELIAPAQGEIQGGYEWVLQEGVWRFNPEIEISVPKDRKIVSMASGKVILIEKEADLNFTVGLDHGAGWKSYYGNLDDLKVTEGLEIKKGAVLGAVSIAKESSLQPCLRLKITHQNQPQDPRRFFN